MSKDGFDINRSRVSDDTLAVFLSSPLDSDIESVPGIGPSSKEKLKAAGIETTIQLMGTFLTLKGIDMDQTQHCDAMWFYLQEIGVNTLRSGIVHCIAEKANVMVPGIYNSDN